MTTTTAKLGSSPDRHIVDRLRRAGSAIRDMASAIRDMASAIRDMGSALGARWRAELAAGQLGPDPETVIGRGTGARI